MRGGRRTGCLPAWSVSSCFFPVLFSSLFLMQFPDGLPMFFLPAPCGRECVWKVLSVSSALGLRGFP